MTWIKIVRLAKRCYGLNKIIWIKSKKYKYAGQCRYKKGIVYLNYNVLRNDENLKIKVLFHELGHLFCYKNGIWKSYHTIPKTIQQKRRLVATGLKAERWIDDWAEKEVKKYIPDFVFYKSYSEKHIVKLYKKNI